MAQMTRSRQEPRIARESFTQGLALLCLLLMGGFAIAGPSGIISWSENQRVLESRKQQIAQLVAERDRLQNRVDLLDPKHADADLTGQLLRSQLNVAHPDEMVMLLK
jgi:cell division protein FtsB